MIAKIENAPKLLLTVDQAAESLAVCQRTIARLIQRGELTPIKIGPRGLRVSVSELERWIAKQQGGEK